MGGRSLAGRVYPTHRGLLVLVQKLEKHGWKTNRRVRTVNGGHYRAAVVCSPRALPHQVRQRRRPGPDDPLIGAAAALIGAAARRPGRLDG